MAILETIADLVVPIDSIRPYKRNPRRGNISAIAESLRVNGQYRPLVVNKRTREILAGNHTWHAAQALGWTEIAVTWVDVTDQDAARIVLVDNRTSDLATYDNVLLSELLAELDEPPMLEGSGFHDDDLNSLLAEIAATDKQARGREGVVSAKPEDPETAPGDVWMLGEHRLACGDASDASTWALEEQFDLLWTDPPYGVSYSDKNEFLNAYDKGNRVQDPIADDHLTPTQMSTLWEAAFAAALSKASDEASYYTTGPQGGDLLLRLLMSIRDAGWQLKHMLVWVKSGHVLGRSDYHYQHEPVLYGWNKRHRWYGDSSQTSTFHVPKPSVSKLHPTMKPVELVERCLVNSTPYGGLVLDMFAGSGTTLIAAENLGRRCHAVEIDAGYCDVIVDRFRSLGTGKEIRRL